MTAGISNGFVWEKKENWSVTKRTHIKYAAFVVLLLFCSTTKRKDQLSELRTQLIQPLLTPAIITLHDNSHSTLTTEVINSSADITGINSVITPSSASSSVNDHSTTNIMSNDSLVTSTPIPHEAPIQTTSTASSASNKTFSSSGTQTSKARRMIASDFKDLTDSRGIPSSKLVETQNERRSQQNSGRRFISRALVDRIKEQENIFSCMAKAVHCGGKKDFLAGVAYSATNTSTANQEEPWDGHLTVQDIIDLAKHVHCPQKKKSVFDILTTDIAARVNHVSSTETLILQDYASQKETFRALRRKLPAFFDSERQTENLKKQWHNEFEVILQPTRTKTGWRINPYRLHECLSFIYPWLKDVECEWWRLYGDARTYGGQKTVLIAISNINNEALFNGCDFQSPEEYWPIHIFYGSDSRIQLELNIGGTGETTGYLNEWCDDMFQKKHNIFVAADAMFADAILSQALDPKSADCFNLYNFETTETRSEVGNQSGLRSGVGRQIEREHPDSLLPSIPTKNFIPCANHMFARITEHLLTLRILSCMDNDAVHKDNRSLEHLLGNINSRGVRNGNFSVKFDGPKLEPITLNVTHAETISAPPEAFKTNYPHILENVSSKNQFELPPKLREAMSWPTPTISEYELEKRIWQINWEMHILCRKDPDPRKEPNRLKPDADKDSANTSDYHFGLLESEIDRYIELGDLFHGLLLLRYGSTRLYPYVMKRVDVVPVLLRELPFHSLFRGSTEGGEHCHYLHQCVYYSHSARGGGWNKEDPVLSVFKWTYRRFRERIAESTHDIQAKFESYVKSKMRESSDDVTEMSNITDLSSVVAEQSLPSNQESNDVGYDQDAVVAEPVSTPDESTPDASTHVTELRRGKQIYFVEGDDHEPPPKKAMVIDVTPRKEHVKVSTSSKSRPEVIPIEKICEAPMLPLKGKTFIISGNISERGDKEKMNTEKLTGIIQRNGGTVFTGNIQSAKDADFIVITSQKEIDKADKKLNKTLSTAYRLKWPIISKNYVLDVNASNDSCSVDEYLLDFSVIDNSSSMMLARARISTQSRRLDNISTVSAHRELKRKVRCQDSNIPRKEKKKKKMKRASTGYGMFLKEKWPQLKKDLELTSFAAVNAEVSRLWAQLSDERRTAYSTLAKQLFEEHLNRSP